MNEDIAKLIKPLAKTATKLNLKKVKESDSLPVIGTHFGGQPYAVAGEEYPVCPTCQNPLTFICQVDMTSGFHEKPEGISLFTFFYCWECFPWGFSDDMKGQWVVRIYNKPGSEKFVLIQSPAEVQYPTQPCIAETEKIVVYPTWDEIDYWSKEISPVASEGNPGSPWEEYSSTVKASGGFDDFATTVGGYTFWVQGEDIVDCEICGERMKLLAQIDSEEKAGLSWGDSGLVYLFFCENHLSEIKLILQCF